MINNKTTYKNRHLARFGPEVCLPLIYALDTASEWKSYVTAEWKRYITEPVTDIYKNRHLARFGPAVCLPLIYALDTAAEWKRYVTEPVLIKYLSSDLNSHICLPNLNIPILPDSLNRHTYEFSLILQFKFILS